MRKFENIRMYQMVHRKIHFSGKFLYLFLFGKPINLVRASFSYFILIIFFPKVTVGVVPVRNVLRVLQVLL